jgi:signal transduction histidine kinase/DNA-binding response OmpR family regulator
MFPVMAGTNPVNGRLGSGIPGSGSVVATNRLVLLIAVPLFLVLAVCAYLTFQFAANERGEQAWVRHTYEVMEAQRRVQDDIQTAETGMRGYLLSHDPTFQAGYRNYLQRLPGDLETFRNLTLDNPAQQARAARLKTLLTQRAAGFEAAVRSNTQAVVRTPQAQAGLMRSRQQMSAIRAETNGGLAEEQRLLRQRDESRRATENMEIAFAIGVGVLTLFALLIAAAMLVRNNVSLAASERARANEAAILQATLETVREGIAYFTSDGLLCAFNATFFELLDLPQRLAVIQKTRLADLVQIETIRPVADQIFSPPSRGQEGTDTQHIVWADRELDIYKAGVATGGFIIGVVDQTARVRAETLARQSQKMEAIGHLTGGVAHDFNNLLQIISANLDLAVAGSAANTDARLRERLQNAIGAVARGSRLTGQLLAFARRQALAPRSLDMGRVIRDMSDMLRRTLGESIQVETVVAGGLWNTLADPNQLENTVLNLAINARDAMPDGGKLTLEVANTFLDDAYASAHAEVTPGQYVMLAVTDTGTGMSPEVMGRVFEPFFTTKPEGKGTGLGLAQAFGFTKQTGGHIKIYSELGHGTTIKLYLPRTRRDADAPDLGGAQAVEGGSETILVVEDDEGVRAAVVDMLTELGYRVLKADQAESALEVLKTTKPDLIFTDVVMPGAIHTRDFTARAQAMHPGIRVLYTSGYTQNAIVHNGKLDDDALLLSKPYRKDELARKLRSVFAGTATGPIRPPHGAPGASLEGKRGKVLVVEDVALIRMTTVDMVEQIGFDAAEASDASEALAMLQKDGSFDILLTDLGLPGMNGRQLVEEVLRMRPEMKIIIASGYSTNEEQGGALKGNISYLTKPFDMQQLRRVLEA